MTAMHPLFDFMPYGAPELIATQRSSQTRALAIASGIAMVVFAMAGLLAPAIPRTTPDQVSVIIDEPPPRVVPPVRMPAAPVPRRTPVATPHPAANPVPLPVPEVTDPPLTQEQAGQSNGSGSGPARASGGTTGSTSRIVEETLPNWGDPAPEVMPQAIVITKPKYPELPRDLGIEGRVYVRMLVGKNGRVMRAEIDPKTSIPMLDASALEAARQWIFTPAKSGGHPVAVWVGEVFDYRIREQ